MQFEAWTHMIRMIPYDSMQGTMTYRPSMQFHAWNHMISCMEPYDSMRFHAWNHIIPCDSMHGNGMKLLHGTIWYRKKN